MNKAAALAKSINAFDIKIDSPQYSDEFFRSVFLRVEETEKFGIARRLSLQIFGFDGENYHPHMSLFYGKLDEAVKIRTIGRISKFKGSFTVNSIYLVKNDEIRLRWEILREFRLKGRKL